MLDVSLEATFNRLIPLRPDEPPMPRTPAPLQEFTKGQRDCLKAVRAGTGGIFHARVVEPLETLGFITDCNGFRLVGCKGFSASRFALTDAGRALFSNEEGR